MNALPAGRTALALEKTGSGTLHYAVTYRYAPGPAAPGQIAGLRVTRVVHPANAADVLTTIGLAAPGAPLMLAPARVFDVELQIITDRPAERVAITDPIPAGLEAVDTSFATASHAARVPSAPWQIGDQQIRADRIEAYADRLDPGIYRLHYLVRSVTEGNYLWPGTEAHVIQQPDVFGRAATTRVIIR
ncbi:MAG: hypothetical protein JOZ24_05645, partial [Candidatus Eremiobacteraeota bacterium]|nr:hypothetical protein [Candidatus Eremiobacteraeota bacterium]